MSYLVLHIDTDFIVGTVCTDNGNSYPVTNDSDDFLWLYFFNNPHQNRISFGKDNRTHYNNKEINYYGRFFDSIENERDTFTIRGIQKKSIELLEYSGLLKILSEKYEAVTHENTDKIPTLITFSLSISELAKQKTIEYLKGRGFQVDSYTIPLSELVCYYPFYKKEYIPATGSIILLVVATNPSLHLMKHTFSGDYFPVDENVKTYKGKGIDPRKRALVKFVVNEINKSTGALSNQEEIEDECARKEQKAEDWLKRLDVQTRNMPLRIVDSLYIMPSTTKEVLVRKDNIEGDTGHYIQELMDVFEAYKSDNVRGDVDAILLLGDCFQNSLVRKRFENQISTDRLFVLTNKDIRDVLSVYPMIDFKRYIDQEERSKALAEAEKQKQAEQRALEDRKRREEEAEAQRIAEIKRIEKNRKEAERLFDLALELEKKGQLDDARLNAENASELDGTNKIYRQFISELNTKIETLSAKNELYKSYINRAEQFIKDQKWEEALVEYENAKTVFDNAEIIKRINEVKRTIKKTEQKKETVSRLLNEAQSLINAGNLSEAREKTQELLSVDNEILKAKTLLSEIDQKQEQRERERQEKENQERCQQFLVIGDDLFGKGKWNEAKEQYENSLSVCPQDARINDKIRLCVAEIKKQEDAISDLMLEANVMAKKNPAKALELLKNAQQIKPSDAELLARIKTLESKLKQPKPRPLPPAGDDDFLPKTPTKKGLEDFLPKKQVKPDDEFIKKPVKAVEEEDDFLGVPKKKKADFDNW